MFAWIRRFFPRKILSVTQQSGGQGEALAANFLKETKRFRVLARNWRNPKDLRDELDLVCQDRDVLVFVEVKTRNAQALVSGYYTIDKRKKKALLRACGAYLHRLRGVHRPRTLRFDVVEVSTTPGLPSEVRHFENVPLFPKAW